MAPSKSDGGLTSCLRQQGRQVNFARRMSHGNYIEPLKIIDPLTNAALHWRERIASMLR